MKKRWMGVVALAALCVLPMHADEASKKAKVEQLFQVMRLDKNMDQLIAGVQAQANAMMRSMPGYDTMTPEQRRLVTDYQAKISALLTQAVGWKAMEPQMVTLYANTYSETEIDGLLSFYKSPVGQTMLDKTPELTKASLELTQQRGQTLRPQLQAMMNEFAKQFTAAGPAPAKPATAPGKTGAPSK